MLARLKMSQKIIGGFVVVVLMLTAGIVLQILAMHKLGGIQHDQARRSANVAQLGNIMETLDMSYAPIADAIINRHLDRTRTDLAELEGQAAKEAELILTLVATEEERGWANEYIANFKGYLAIFKDQVLPLLTAKAGEGQLDAATMNSIRALDDQFDVKRDAADAALAKIILTFTQEMEEADALYEQTHSASVTLATIIAIVSALFAMTIALLLTRAITRPINDGVRDLSNSSDQIAAAAGQVSSSSQHLADGASEQASALEETSASMEELTSMTRQNADNADQADSLMRQSLTTINNTNAAMGEMDHSMGQIASASAETFKIIKTIDEIAFQTNLLALNAAVEAARAGEAGAGFAVVADEVRSLAMRATDAAKNTAQLIEDTVHKVNAGKEIVTKVTSAFREVTESSTKVGSLLGEISTASREQSKGIAQINQAIVQMDSVTQTAAASSEESAAAAEELNAQAAGLIEIVMALRSLVAGQRQGGYGQAGRSVVKAQAPARSTEPPRQHKTAAARAVPKPALIAAAPSPAQKSPAVLRKEPQTNPESVIPMDDDDNFADF